MCGIFGWWAPGAGPMPLDRVRDGAQRLLHRGPDDLGYVLIDTRSGRVARCGGPETEASLELPPLEAFAGESFDLALAHRRLAILDPSPAGHQPMESEDGRHWIVFNGEIYNFVELRRELEADGVRFRSRSDTEVLLAAWQRHGPALLSRLVGMFAFCIVDREARRLWLARDAFGIKPLYHAAVGEGFAFASEPAPLLDLPGVSRTVNPERLYDYLRFGWTDHGDETLFAGIRQLPAANVLSLPLAPGGAAEPAPKPAPYWRLDPDARNEIPLEAAARELRDRFVNSVALHLRSDVPVGTALSGGIDSSAILLAAREVGGRDLHQHAFGFVADDAGLSEERWMDLAADAAEARLHKVRPAGADLAADLETLIAAQGEPFGSTSIFAQYRVFRAAREAGVPVMLDGQGADELFGGYRSYLGARLASLLRHADLAGAAALIRAVRRLPDAPTRGVLTRAAGAFLPGPLRAIARRLVGEDLAPAWLDADWFRARGVALEEPWRPSGRDVLRDQLLAAFTHNSLPMLLRYEDRSSMASSVESRVPFLTPELAEFVFSLPEEHLVSRDATTKSVLRLALRGLVPDAILDRRDKIGFATPEVSWLAALQPFVEELSRAAGGERVPVIQWPAALRHWDQIRSGARPNRFEAWRWINLGLWARRFDVRFDDGTTPARS